MVRRVELAPGVYDEIESARAWYEARRDGLGEDFLDEIEHAVRVIRTGPEVWPVVERRRGIRRVLVRRFPFALLYRLLPDGIQIVAAMHLHRKPGYWRKRKQHR